MKQHLIVIHKLVRFVNSLSFQPQKSINVSLCAR